MLTYEFFVWLTFRTIDLFVVVIFISYIFYRFGLPRIKKRMMAEQEEKQQLKNQEYDLEQQAEQLDNTIVDDKQEAVRLQHNLRFWQTVQQQKIDERQVHKERVKNELEAMMEQKVLTAAQDKLYHTVIPRAVAQAEIQLKTSFESDQVGQDYIKQVLKVIGKEMA